MTTGGQNLMSIYGLTPLSVNNKVDYIKSTRTSHSLKLWLVCFLKTIGNYLE